MDLFFLYVLILSIVLSLSLLLLLPAYLILRKYDKRKMLYLFLLPIAMLLVSPSFSTKGQEIGTVHLEEQTEEHGQNIHLLNPKQW